ncbi:MobA/MobL family protein [Limnohabitans parvus]|nr:MobA/MobL family protein [Limnohabitans parvus]
MSYVSGIGAYSDKSEVKHIVDKHIPSFAADALDFFDLSDKLERQNGRSYRSLVIAIPREAPNALAWAQSLVDDLLKDRHAYRLVIHDKGDGNPHAHVVFSERGLKEGKTPKDFFSRQNAKDRSISTKPWLKQAKAVYLMHVRTVAPDYVPPNSGEIKIGPKLKGAKPSYTDQREAMSERVDTVRKGERIAVKLDEKIDALKAEIEQERRGHKVATPSPSSRSTAQPQQRGKTLPCVRSVSVSSNVPQTQEQLQRQTLRHLEMAVQYGEEASRIAMEADQMLHDANMRLKAAMKAPFTPSSQVLRRNVKTSSTNTPRVPKRHMV